MTTCTKSESASEKNTKKVSEITLNFTEEINKLNFCFEDKNIPNILVQLRVLMKHVNSKPNVRSFRDLQGLKLLVTILIYYTRDYVIQSHMEHSQLISLIVGILGNCCIQSNLVQSSILSNDTLKCLINILSDGEIENRGKLWSDVVKLLFVLKVHKPHHIELLCELGLVEMLLGAFNREDNKSIMSVIKLFTGLTHSLHICVRMIDTSGITILLEYSHRIEEDSTIIEVLKIFTNILRHKKDILASSFNSHGGVYKVIELCQSKNSQISSVAWECFLEFNNSSETRASIGNAGGIQLLLSKLSSYPPNEMPQHLIDIMSGCSNDPSNRQHIKLSNALQFIIDVLKEVNSVKTKIQLLHTINHYYYDEESFVFMVKQLKLVDTLTHLLQQINEAIKASSEDTEQDSSSTEIHIPTNMQMNELSFLASDSFIQSADSSDGAGNTQSLISWMECHLLHLLSKISHIKSCLIYLASSDIFRALILYILVSRNPHFKCVKILQRISQDNACFEKLLRYGNIPLFYELCIHAESLPPGYIGISKLDMSNCPVYAPTEEYNLMDKITRTAETPYGMGVINSMLKGSAVERTTCVLSLPYLFRTHKRRFFHDFTGTVSSLINILSDPVDEEQFQQSIKAFSYLCEVLHKPIPTDLPHRLCLSPTSPPSQSPSSYSPPHDYNTAYMNSTPSQWYSRSPSKYMDDSGSELSSGALSDEDYSYDSSARRQYKLNRAIRPEVGSIEYCPPAKRPHIDTEASLLDSNDLTVFTEQNSNVCFYSKFNEKDFDFEFCVENKSFRVHVDKIEASSDVLGAMIRWARATSSGSCVAFTLVPAFIFESIIHQIYYCDYSCPTISNMLWPHDQDQNTDFQNPNDIQLKHINFLTDHATSLSPSMNILLKDVFKATQDQSSIFPGYHDPSSTSSSNLFTKFLHLLSLFFTTDILIMNYKTKVTTSLGRHISPNNAVALLVLSIEFHWCLLANKICRYIFRDICTSLRRSCIQQIMKYPQTVTDEIFEIFNQMIMEIVLK